MKKPTHPATHKKIAPAATNKPTLRQTFIMTNRNGLHARPCAVLIKTLRPFACDVKVEGNGEAASGNSILGLMALAAGFESKVSFIISGSEAARAMAAVQRLFETRFEEAYASENKAAAK
jgi:phosphotransferase system HPr (HPr) family protein